jgi:hypothetical protein
MIFRLLLSTLFLIGVGSSSPNRATLALLTTSASSTGNLFTAGTVHISDSLEAGTTLSMQNLIAGDTFDAELRITNSGSLGLNYALTTSTSGDATLASAILVTVRPRTTNPCTSRDGLPILYTGALSSAAVGNPAHGGDPTDRILGAGASEVLCFTIELPTSVTTQDALVTATFLFDAEQS